MKQTLIIYIYGSVSAYEATILYNVGKKKGHMNS